MEFGSTVKQCNVGKCLNTLVNIKTTLFIKQTQRVGYLLKQVPCIQFTQQPINVKTTIDASNNFLRWILNTTFTKIMGSTKLLIICWSIQKMIHSTNARDFVTDLGYVLEEFLIKKHVGCILDEKVKIVICRNWQNKLRDRLFSERICQSLQKNNIHWELIKML